MDDVVAISAAHTGSGSRVYHRVLDADGEQVTACRRDVIGGAGWALVPTSEIPAGRYACSRCYGQEPDDVEAV